MNKTELTAEIELIDAVIETEHIKLLQMFDEVIDNFVIKGSNCVVVSRKRVTVDWQDSLFIAAEVGFLDDDNKIDFGSDFTIEYSAKDGLFKLNKGTMGYISRLNTCHVKSAILVADLFKNIDKIEEALQSIVLASEVFVKQYKLRQDCVFELMNIESKEMEESKDKLVEALSEGDILEYSDEIYPRYRLFPSQHDVFRISRICDKTIKIKGDVTGMVKQFDKKRIAQLLYNKHVFVKKETE